jgi:excisionase family DNA binding protein
MKDEKLYTSSEVMRYLKIKRTAFNRYIASGNLRGRKVGQQWRFFAHEVKAVIRRIT